MTEPADLSLSHDSILNAIGRGYDSADSIAKLYHWFPGYVGHNRTTTIIVQRLEQLKQAGRIKKLPNNHTLYPKLQRYETI